jgi:hypothetical protein
MKGVAQELTRIAEGLTGELPPKLPPEMPAPADRFALYAAMCKLNVSMFEELIFRAEAPVAHLAPATMPLARRALDLVQWAENQGSLQRFTDAILKVAPGALRRN